MDGRSSGDSANRVVPYETPTPHEVRLTRPIGGGSLLVGALVMFFLSVFLLVWSVDSAHYGLFEAARKDRTTELALAFVELLGGLVLLGFGWRWLIASFRR
jgi:hypothetical protein